MNSEKFKFLKLRVKNVIDVGIIKMKFLAELKIQNYAKDVQKLLIMNLVKSNFFYLKRKASFYFPL